MIIFIYLAGFFITAVVLYTNMKDSFRVDGDFIETLMTALLATLFATVWPVIILAGLIALTANWIQKKVAEIQKNAVEPKNRR